MNPLSCNFDKNVILAKLECEDTVAKVVPVNYEFATSDPADQLHKRKGWYTWRILTSSINVVIKAP